MTSEAERIVDEAFYRLTVKERNAAQAQLQAYAMHVRELACQLDPEMAVRSEDALTVLRMAVAKVVNSRE